MLNTKVIIGIIIVALMGGGYYAWNQKTKEVNTLTTTVAIVKIAEKSAEDTIIKTEGANKITEATAVAIVEKTTAIAIKQNNIRAAVNSNVSKMEKEYSLKIQTLADQKELNDKTSKLMIDGFWDSYCLGMPNDTSCIKQL